MVPETFSIETNLGYASANKHLAEFEIAAFHLALCSGRSKENPWFSVGPTESCHKEEEGNSKFMYM